MTARNSRRPWTEDDISFLRCHGHMGAYYMAGDLGRTESAIYLAASKHKIPLGGTLGPRKKRTA